jgi:hypothetical protein
MTEAQVITSVLTAALSDAALRESFNRDFETTLEGMRLPGRLSVEGLNTLKNAFQDPNPRAGHCSDCDYDMSCGRRGYSQ